MSRRVVLLVWMLGWGVLGAAAQVPALDGWDPAAHRDTLRLDRPQPFRLRPFVLPETLTLLRNGAPVDTTAYRLEARTGRLWMVPEPDAAVDTVVARYRTLPFDLAAVYRRRGVVEADTAGGPVVVRDEPEAEGRPYDPFRGTSLRRSGSISRGVIAGNNRDVTLESGLRMELSGEITEGVEVQAALTDENTPIQPEGTTQRINDFDRVFLELRARRGAAQLGDVDFAVDGGAFAPFARKLQGAALTAEVPGAGPAFAGATVRAAGAVARGEFRRQEIEPLDGIQGPYRLEGAGGERFIIVIAGSETVYLDGVRLVRGESNDYTIDYATGELTFTPRRLITEDRRITVEFQYTTNQFTRTLVASEAEVRLWPGRDGGPARARLAATFLREADSEEFDDVFDLSREDSLALARAGDGVATVSGAEPVVFDPEAPFVQYRREALRPPEGEIDSIFVAVRETPRPDETVYRVRFSRVGQGRGAYERVGRSVNGILYEYRGPGGGDYLPVRLLPTPRRQRVFDLRGGFDVLPGLEVHGEWARSLLDANRFSTLDDADAYGDAYLGGLRLEALPLEWGARDLGTVSARYDRRFTAAAFAPLDRIRAVEFDRAWNLGVQDGSAAVASPSVDETIDEGALAWVLRPGTRAEAGYGRLRRAGRFRGTRRTLAAAYAPEERAWLPALAYDGEYITSRDAEADEAGRWLRQMGRLSTALGALVPRLEAEHEHRRQRVTGTDSLTDQSFAFLELRPGVGWTGETLEAGGEVEWRTEQRGALGAFRHAATAWTAQAALRYRPTGAFDVETTLGYRSRRFTDFFRVERRREDTESLILRLKGRAEPAARVLSIDWFYEGQTERTPRLQEIYVRTGPELGQYVWQDANDDGLIQVDEFVPETTPNEGAYVRTFIPSDTLLAVASVQARLRLALDPSRLFEEPERRWARALSHVTTRTTVEVLEKTRDPALARVYLLDLTRFRDSANTLNGRLRLGQDVTLFRTVPRYGLDLSFDQVRGLSELAAGTETRFQNTWRTEGRYQLTDAWSVEAAGQWARDRSLSDSLSSRRYDIEAWAAEPEVAFRPARAWQLLAGLHLARKRDGVGARTARVLRVPVQARYSRVGRLQLQARLEGSRVSLDGEAAGLAQYELTDGRGPGTSYLWSLSGQWRLTGYVRATLAYDGRAPADAPVIHTARVELSATF